MRILFVANRDKRQRYKYLMEPLERVGVEIDCFKEKSNLVATMYHGIRALQSKPKSQVVVLIGGDMRNVLWLLLLRICTRAKVVVRFGGDPIAVRRSARSSFWHAKNMSSAMRSLLGLSGTRLILKNVDGVIVVSEFLANAVKPLIRPETQLMISPPVLLKEPKPKSSYCQHSAVFNLLSVTNLNYSEKADGLLTIAEAVTSLCQNRPDLAINLNFVGGGKKLDQVKHKIQSMKLPKNCSITLHGQQNDVSEYYETADLFVYHSVLDSYSLVLMEASAYGLPLVINRWGPFPQQYEDGDNALFFETGNKSQLENVLIKLIHDDKYRAALGQNALRQYQNKQAIEPIGTRLASFFHEVMQ